jgi:DNA-binding response OmpR family regulator
MARIRAIFRRLDNMALEKAHELGTTPAPSETKRLKVGRLLIDLLTREVIYEGRAIGGITNKEYELLVTLAHYPGRVYSKGELEESLYGYDSMLESRSIGVHISNLRNKLPNPKLIETVYGIGYKLAREIS